MGEGGMVGPLSGSPSPPEQAIKEKNKKVIKNLNGENSLSFIKIEA